MESAYTIRPMTPADTDTIGQQREAMFREANRPAEAIAAMSQPFRAWLRPKLEANTYLGYALEHEAKIVGGSGLMIVDWPPHPLHPTDPRRGYLLNVYVDPAHRGQGHARRLVEATYAGARAHGIAYITLHASALGRPVYQSMGWRDTDEMSLTLPAPD